MTITGTLEPLFPEVWLHERPRVTHTKGTPTYRVSRADAFGFEYIEPNVTGQIQSLIITDRDKPDADRIAVGRNVALFDDTRAWAYKAVRRFWGAPIREWKQAVTLQAIRVNNDRIGNDFSTGPLSLPEVGHLATSVAGWVWTNFTPEAFSARQAQLGRRRAEQRSSWHAELLEVAK